MKYWAYINDEVSQKPYSEAELQQIAGFGPNTLICSETSAVSQEPDWKTVKELLPHLIRPKAPNFSKFRPKPPMNQDNSEVSPVTASSPEVNATPTNTPGYSDNNVNERLLSQIQSLTTKIASLEGKVSEQNQRLMDSNLEEFPEIEEEETFISEPQNDQEDDVLEVPFDNDFEIPFDANKSSEEIAREAEEILAKPVSTEIEEYNTDDQRTELIDYASDMQKILEDTIRKTNFYPKPTKEEKTQHTRTFIAEDLISKTTLNLSDEPKKKDEDQKDDKDKESAADNKKAEKQGQEKQPKAKGAEVKSLDELLEGADKKQETTDNETSAVTETTPEADSKPAEEESAKEEPVEEKPVEEKPIEKEPVKEEPVEKELVEEEPIKSDLASVDDVPSAKHEEQKPVEEEPVKSADLVPLEESAGSKAEEKKQIESKEVQNVSNEESNEKEKDVVDSDKASAENDKKDLKENSLEKASQDNTEQQDDNKLEELINSKESDQNSDAEELNIPEPNNEEVERLANTSIMNGITISDDDTTAAVLDEIAREKEQSTKIESTASRLFEQLENTYKDENNETKKSVTVGEVDLREDLDDGSSPEDESSSEDEFLKTFTTSVEEVFLDQPTAIISDYVPPSEDKNAHATSTGTESNIKRAKPSDIKTVPLVPDALGQEIWSSPYVESATAKLGRGVSSVINLLKWIFLIFVLALMGCLLLSGLAVMGIVPENLSPIHAIIYSLQKTPQGNNNSSVDEDLEPAIIEEEKEVPVVQEEAIQPSEVIDKVKNYAFNNGTTLQERINAINENLIDEIEWSAVTTEEQDVYSVAVKMPQNKEGQGFSYRFNYNVANNVLTPTTSEAKNIMENSSK